MPSRYRGRMVKKWETMDRQLREGYITALSDTAERVRKELENVTRKWKNKPRWIKRQAPKQDRNRHLAWQVIATGDERALKIWGWVDKGTEAHIILPKKPGGMLAFNMRYSARTLPIANANAGTGRASGDRVFSRGVIHPGSEPREFAAYYALEAEEFLILKLKQLIRTLSRRI